MDIINEPRFAHYFELDLQYHHKDVRNQKNIGPAVRPFPDKQDSEQQALKSPKKQQKNIKLTRRAHKITLTGRRKHWLLDLNPITLSFGDEGELCAGWYIQKRIGDL